MDALLSKTPSIGSGTLILAHATPNPNRDRPRGLHSDLARQHLFIFAENNSLAFQLSPVLVHKPVHNRFLMTETPAKYAPCTNCSIFDHPCSSCANLKPAYNHRNRPGLKTHLRRSMECPRTSTQQTRFGRRICRLCKRCLIDIAAVRSQDTLWRLYR